MIPFALALTPEQRAGLETFIQGLFVLFAIVSFVRVGVYASAQLRSGQLLPVSGGPTPLTIQPMPGWFFVLSVVGLIYLQSALYAIIVIVGSAGIVAENRQSWSAVYGLDRIQPERALAWSLVIFGAIMFVEEPLYSAWKLVLDTFGWSHPEQQLIDTFRGYSNPLEILAFVFEAVILFPFIEELFFRGFLLTFLRHYLPAWAAVVVSAAIFAGAHLNLGAVVPLWFLGIVLGVAYQHTGSLIVPIGVHACFNLATSLSVLLEKANS